MDPDKHSVKREVVTLRNVARILKWDNVFFVVLIAAIYGGLSITEKSYPARLSGWFVVLSAVGAFLYFAFKGLFRLELAVNSIESPASVSNEWLRRAKIVRRAPFFVAPLVVALVINAIIAHPVLSLIFTVLIVQCQAFLLVGAREFERRAERIASLEGTA